MEGHIHFLKASSKDTELICETALFEIRVQKNIIQVLGVYKPLSAKLDQISYQTSLTMDYAARSQQLSWVRYT